MSKKRLKNDHLAKLRQFQKGMDVEDYLSSQHRQVIRALEESYVDVDFSTIDSEITQLQSQVQSQLKINKGFFAINTNTYSGTTTANYQLPFNSYYDSGSIGTVVSPANVVFRPLTNGKFWVEATCEWTTSGTPPVGGLHTSSFSIFNESAVSQRSVTFQWFGGGLTNPSLSVVGNSVSTIVDMTTSNGVYFAATLNYATIAKLSFKIYRIGD